MSENWQSPDGWNVFGSQRLDHVDRKILNGVFGNKVPFDDDLGRLGAGGPFEQLG